MRSVRTVLLAAFLLSWPIHRHLVLGQQGERTKGGHRTPPSWGAGVHYPAEHAANENSVGGEGAGGVGEGGFKKLVALVPVRDEAHLLESCLQALAHLVHAIVVMDDCSTDGSGDRARELAVRYKVERVARSPNCPAERPSTALPYWGSEAAHRGFLLSLGRSVGGTHFLAIDADEAIVAGAGGEEEFAGLRESILQMRPGDLFVMDYVTMYGSMDTFRRDKGDMKAVGFADQEGAAFRRSARDDRLHTPRIPHIPRPGQVWELKTAAAGRPPHVAVLHFGFSQLANARMKNVVYNMFDVVTGTAKTPAEMNAGLDAMGITTAAQQRITRAALATAPPAWRACLGAAFDRAVLAASPVAAWREACVLAWLAEGAGPARFLGLDALRVLASHAPLSALPGADRPRTRAMLARLAVG